jgi:hypothetical protein
LPALIGPEDTQLAVSLGCWLIAFIGPSSLEADYDFGMGKMKLSHTALAILMIFEFIGMGGHVYSSIIEKMDEDHFKKRFNLTCFMTQVMILPIMIVVWTGYLFVPGTKSRDEYNMLVLACFGAQFLQCTHRLMVCDVTLAPFYAIRRTHVLVWALLAANAVFLFSSEGK